MTEHQDFGGLQQDLERTGRGPSAAISNEVYATAGYEQSVRNFKRMSLATDGVFRDGAALEIATMSGTVAKELTATLTVAV